MHVPSPPPPCRVRRERDRRKGQRLDCSACRKGVAAELSLRPDCPTVFARIAPSLRRAATAAAATEESHIKASGARGREMARLRKKGDRLELVEGENGVDLDARSAASLSAALDSMSVSTLSALSRSFSKAT